MLRANLLIVCLVFSAASHACAEESTYDHVDWCSDGFDQRATVKFTDQGLELSIGSTVELLNFDGGLLPTER